MAKSEKHKKMIRLYKEGYSTVQIAAMLSVSRTTVLRNLHKIGIYPPRKNKKLSEKMSGINVSRCSRCGGGPTERDEDGLTPVNNRLTGQLEVLCSNCLCPDIEVKLTEDRLKRFSAISLF